MAGGLTVMRIATKDKIPFRKHTSTLRTENDYYIRRGFSFGQNILFKTENRERNLFKMRITNAYPLSTNDSA